MDIMEDTYKDQIKRHLDCMQCPVCIPGTLMTSNDILSCDSCGFRARIDIDIESMEFEG